MTTESPSWVRRGLPLTALLLAAFSTTWVLRQQSREAVTPSPPPAQSAPVAQLIQRVDPVKTEVDSEFAQPQPGIESEPEQPAPSLVELAGDPDPGTQAEAQTLLTLLDEEARAD